MTSMVRFIDEGPDSPSDETVERESAISSRSSATAVSSLPKLSSISSCAWRIDSTESPNSDSLPDVAA